MVSKFVSSIELQRHIVTLRHLFARFCLLNTVCSMFFRLSSSVRRELWISFSFHSMVLLIFAEKESFIQLRSCEECFFFKLTLNFFSSQKKECHTSQQLGQCWQVNSISITNIHCQWNIIFWQSNQHILEKKEV